MNPVNDYASKDVVAFCEKRLDPAAMREALRNESGVSYPSVLKICLVAGDRISVLKAVWSKPTPRQRLDLLKELDLGGSDPVLLYERAVAMYECDPTMETISTFSMPMIVQATMIARLDSWCSSDPSTVDVPNKMRRIYIQVLKLAIAERAPDLDLDNPPEEYGGFLRKARMGAAAIQAQSTLSNPSKFSDPTWVGWHGEQAKNTGGPAMHPRSEWPVLRLQAMKALFRELQASLPSSDLQWIREYLSLSSDMLTVVFSGSH